MNSADRIAAERYAAAYNELSATNEQAICRAEALQTAVQALKAVHPYMTDPRVTVEEKKKAVQTALRQAPETASLVALLLEAKRYALLEAVNRRVGELLDERLGIVRAEVISAVPLRAEQRHATTEVLSSRYGARVEASFSVEPALLGGLRIRCKGELIEGSLQGRLAKLQEELMH